MGATILVLVGIAIAGFGWWYASKKFVPGTLGGLTPAAIRLAAIAAGAVPVVLGLGGWLF